MEGNLIVHGSVKGFGLLVATGDITIDAGTVLQGATQLAVLSGGRVTLRGSGPNSTVIRGVFYAERGLMARQMTVIGAMIAGGPDAGVSLDDVSVYTQESLASLPAGSGSPSQAASNTGLMGGGLIGGQTSEDPWLIFGNTTRLPGLDDGGVDNGPAAVRGPRATAAQPVPTTPETPTSTTAIGGPSSFISMRDRMKVVSWFEN